MSVATRESIPLTVCLGVSCLIHALVLVPWIGAAMGVGAAAVPPDETLEQEQDSQTRAEQRAEIPNPLMRRATEMERVELGIDQGSDQPLTTWIGYDEYQEHLARLAEIDQAAMRMTEAGGGEPSAAPPGAMSLASPLHPPLPDEAPPSPVVAVERAAETGQLATARPTAPELEPDRQANAPPASMRAIESAPPTREAPTAAVPSPADESVRTTANPPLDPVTQSPSPPTPPSDVPSPSPAVTTPPPPSLTLPRSEDPATGGAADAPLPPKSAPNEAPKIEPFVRPADGPAKSDAPTEAPPLESPPAPTPDAKPDETPIAPTPGTKPDSDGDATRTPEVAIAPTIAPLKLDPTLAAPEPESKPVRAPADDSITPPHPDPDRASPPAPPPRPEGAPTEGDAPGAPTRPAGTPGPPVAGELTDRESDPTSTINVPADQWRNGKPLAARGLQILTRRPEMLPEYLAIQTGAGRNPVFELQFDREGRVRKVTMLEGSGSSQLDGRLIDCLYKWRARGARLAAVKPNDRLKLSMRMLVR